MKLFIFVIFFLAGFVRVFSSCYMMRRVFRWKVRGYLWLSLAAGGALFVSELVYRLITGSTFALEQYLMGAVFIPAVWLCITDRSPGSLAVAFSAYLFTDCAGIILGSPAQLLVSFLSSGGSSDVIGIFVSMLRELAPLGLVILVGRLARSRVTVPMSIWNILFTALSAAFASELILFSSEESSTLAAAGMSLLSAAFLVISVVMTVKLTESRYFSTLNSINENYLNVQKDYYEIKQSADTEIRRIRHDMKNHLICIRDLARQEKYAELADYISEISETVNDAGRLIHTGSGIIDAIVNEKAALAAKAHVRFEWEGTVSGLNISAVDSCTLVSNLLDNALEACDKVDVAKRFISMTFRRSEHFLLMSCENSSPRVVELSGGRPLSSKADKFSHGFGLENIQRCVEKYGGHLDLSSFTEQDIPVFRAEAVIPLDSV